MKRTPKRILGFLGLILVAAMTLFAAAIPTPEASAVEGVTDTIVVRVLPSSPDVNITYPPEGTIFVSPEHTIEFDFSQVDDVLVKLGKKMPDGSIYTYPPFYEGHPAQVPGSDSANIDLSGPEYGFGEYVVIITGTVENSGGMFDEDTISFTYAPVTADVEETDAGKVFANLNYDDNNVDLDHFTITVYDENENPVPGLTGIIVNRPDKRVELPFGSDIPNGEYTIVIGAIDKRGDLIYKTYDKVFKYEQVYVPNTGGLFKSLNIAKSDYLITGLIIFFTIGIVGLYFIAKDRKSVKKNTRRK